MAFFHLFKPLFDLFITNLSKYLLDVQRPNYETFQALPN